MKTERRPQNLVLASFFSPQATTSTSTNTDAADGVARKEHGINDGSGHRCHDHSYTGIDGDAAKRIESLTTILASKYGVQDARLVRALCALGEGELQLDF